MVRMTLKAPLGAVRRAELDGVDDAGRAERIVIWIERRPGASGRSGAR